jgi:hypothetical protein
LDPLIRTTITLGAASGEPALLATTQLAAATVLTSAELNRGTSLRLRSWDSPD